MRNFRQFDQKLSDDALELRETYAAYGRAVHVASVLEAHLAFALILGDFVKKITIKAERMGGLSQKQYQSELAAYKKKLFGKTMGQMIRHTRTLTLFDYALRVRLAEEKKRRNFLVHHFWQERLMCSVHESPAPGGGRPKGKTKSICRPLGLS